MWCNDGEMNLPAGDKGTRVQVKKVLHNTLCFVFVAELRHHHKMLLFLWLKAFASGPRVALSV